MGKPFSVIYIYYYLHIYIYSWGKTKDFFDTKMVYSNEVATAEGKCNKKIYQSTGHLKR